MKFIRQCMLVLAFLGGQITLATQQAIEPKRTQFLLSDTQNADKWLEKAASDLASAQMLVQNMQTLDTALYHTQQCFEKSLKAFLVAKTKDATRTHDLLELLNLVIKIDPAFEQFRQYAHDLTPYATCYRYPGYECYYAHGQKCYLTKEEVLSSINKAESILDFVKKRLRSIN